MKGSTLDERPRGGMLKRILGGEVRDKTIGKYGELKEAQEEKKVRECGARHKQKTIVDGEIGRRTKAQEE